MSAPVDPDLLARIRAEEAVGTPSGAPFRGWALHLLESLGERIARAVGGFGLLEEALIGLFWVVLAAVLVGLALFLYRALRRMGRRAPAQDDGRVRVSGPPPPAGPVDLAAELERALQAGDLHEGLRVLWAFVATGLATRGRIELRADTTQRELVDQARAHDPGWAGLLPLGQLARFVEGARFAGRPVEAEQIRGWVPRARALVEEP